MLWYQTCLTLRLWWTSAALPEKGAQRNGGDAFRFLEIRALFRIARKCAWLGFSSWQGLGLFWNFCLAPAC